MNNWLLQRMSFIPLYSELWPDGFRSQRVALKPSPPAAPGWPSCRRRPRVEGRGFRGRAGALLAEAVSSELR